MNENKINLSKSLFLVDSENELNLINEFLKKIGFIISK